MGPRQGPRQGPQGTQNPRDKEGTVLASQGPAMAPWGSSRNAKLRRILRPGSAAFLVTGDDDRQGVAQGPGLVSLALVTCPRLGDGVLRL